MSARLERLLQAQAETARTINRLILTMLGLAIASLLPLGFPDSYLLSSAAKVSVPFAGGASFKTLLFFAPLALIAVRAYLQIYFEHWQRLDRLTRQSQTRRVPVLSPLRHPLLRLLVAFVRYPLVPMSLASFTWVAMVFREWGLALLFLTVTSAVILLIQSLALKWRYKLLCPSLALACIFGAAEYAGQFDDFRRPFRLQLANLDRAILKDLDLRRAELNRARLTDADLSRTNLELARLQKADLQNANLFGAQMKEVRLQGARLQGANLSRATSLYGHFGKANLQGADLENAQMNQTGFIDALLQKANLKSAMLQGSNFDSANLEGANLSFADLRGAHFHHTRLQEANLNNAFLSEANFRGAQMQRANLPGADLRKARVIATKLQGANLRVALLNASDLSGTNLEGADLTGAVLQEANLTWVKLMGAELEFADLQGSYLGGVDLTGAKNFEKAKTSDAVFCETTLPDGTVRAPDCDAHESSFEWSGRRAERSE